MVPISKKQLAYKRVSLDSVRVGSLAIVCDSEGILPCAVFSRCTNLPPSIGDGVNSVYRVLLYDDVRAPGTGPTFALVSGASLFDIPPALEGISRATSTG